MSNTQSLVGNRTTAIFSVSLPPEMATELERVRKVEHRTRSELVREALRHYIRESNSRSLTSRIANLPEEVAAPDELEAIREGVTDLREGRHATLNQLRHVLRRSSH